MIKKLKHTENPNSITNKSFLHEYPFPEEPFYDNLPSPITVQNILLSAKEEELIYWHRYEEITFILMNSGTLKFQTKDQEVLLKSGHGLFINQNQWYTMRCSSEEDCCFYFLAFHPAFLFGSEHERLHMKYWKPLQSSSVAFIHLTKKGEDTSPILPILRDIFASNLKKPFGYELRIKGSLYEIWYLLLIEISHRSFLPSKQPVVETSDVQRIQEAIHFIEERYREQVTLDDIAATIHISKSECCRCFKRSLGLTPFEYLIKYRIYQSTYLLRQEGHRTTPISRLAEAVGFNSTSYYNKLFKKYLHCTPLEYRKQFLASPLSRVQVSQSDLQVFSHLL